jgi:hypothetical protein
MIKFFRKIRQNLLSEGRTSKYLKYALGEIILVVIGILIALSINNWNQNKEKTKQENQILNQLLIEYTNNLNQLNSKIDIRQEILKSSFILLYYRKKDVNIIEADSFNLRVSRMITRPTFDPELGVTNELNNSGRLYLLKNETLRNKITSFPSLLSEVQEEERVTFNHVENLLIPFIIEHYQTGKIIAEFLDDAEFKKAFTLSNSEKYTSIKDLFEQVDFKPLLMHPDFEDHIALMISNTTYTNQQSIGVKDKSEAIISIIKKEMESNN